MRPLLFLFLFSLFLFPGRAAVKLPRLISNGMVLQRGVKLNIWGWSSGGETIIISFNGKRYLTKADRSGNWKVILPPQQAGGPFEMLIKGSNEIYLRNILIGDVWVCGGQSNMELPIERVKYKYATELASWANDNIRQFLVPDKFNFNAPRQDVDEGAWLPADEKNIYQFSAAAYFFAKDIYEKYKVPVGLINTALGGSPAEAWVSEEALKKFPAYYQEAQRFKDRALIERIETGDRTTSTNWYRQLNEKDEGEKNNWKDWTIPATGHTATGWKQMPIPGYWADAGEASFNGAVWFVKSFEVPASMLNKSVKLELGRLVDTDSAFINGQFVGTTGYQYPPRRYLLPASLLREGVNHIVVRLVNTSGKGGFVPDKPYELTTTNDTIDLKGNWWYKTGAIMPPLPAATFIRWKPLGLYNAMIAPLINFSIKGVIWYQGEANTSHPNDYKELMQTLIEDWRFKWGQGDFPFLFVQLANYMKPVTTPQESNWALLRQQQLNTLSVPNTAMAVAIDVGEWNDIHPENKKDIGSRLALQARKLAYGERNIVASGPIFRSIDYAGNKIVLHFDETGSGLMAEGHTGLKYFAIAGADKKYIWANAIIKDNTVIVWHDDVHHPVSVRYAWADNPQGANLYNREGLPASPFSTDK